MERIEAESAAELSLAGRLVRAAGAAALQHYGRAAPLDRAAPSPVTAADLAANRVLVAGIAEAFPADAVLSEESKDSAARLHAERVWIIDPLDGTKEFLARNGEFSIQLGLVVEGEPVVAAVYLPATDVLYSAIRGEGAWVERGRSRTRLRCGEADGGALRLVGSRSHPDPLLERMRSALGITRVRPAGSVGVKCALLAENECDLYIHPVPYLKEWDTCAPELILREAGGGVTDCRGRALRYNKPRPTQPDGILAWVPGVPAAVREQVIEVYTDDAGRPQAAGTAH